MSVTESRGIREDVTWTPTLVKMLRGERTPSEFGKLLGVSKHTVSVWENGRVRPLPEQAQRLIEFAKRERFLEDWQLVGSMELVGDLEDGPKEVAEIFKQSLVRSSINDL
jgi:DNA-binding XRE family transcriptional regulator